MKYILTEEEKQNILAAVLSGKPIIIECERHYGEKWAYMLKKERIYFDNYGVWWASVDLNKEMFLKLIFNGSLDFKNKSFAFTGGIQIVE